MSGVAGATAMQGRVAGSAGGGLGGRGWGRVGLGGVRGWRSCKGRRMGGAVARPMRRQYNEAHARQEGGPNGHLHHGEPAKRRARIPQRRRKDLIGRGAALRFRGHQPLGQHGRRQHDGRLRARGGQAGKQHAAFNSALRLEQEQDQPHRYPRLLRLPGRRPLGPAGGRRRRAGGGRGRGGGGGDGADVAAAEGDGAAHRYLRQQAGPGEHGVSADRRGPAPASGAGVRSHSAAPGHGCGVRGAWSTWCPRRNRCRRTCRPQFEAAKEQLAGGGGGGRRRPGHEVP